MEAKLAEYRAKKQAEAETQERKNKIWDAVTLKFLRSSGSNENQTGSQDNDAGPETEAWTKVDYAILSVKILMWLVGQIIFVKLGFGAVYFTTSAFAIIWLSLGNERRGQGQLSAYSVFNPNCKNIQGALTAEHFENEIRHRKK